MKTVLVTILLTSIAGLCWAQSPASCLVVRVEKHSKYIRVASIGNNVGFKLRYSGKEIRQIQKEGVNTVILSKKATTDTPLTGCSQDMGTRIEHMVAKEVATETMQTQTPQTSQTSQTSTGKLVPADPRNDLTCKAWLVTKAGDQTCVQRQ